MSSCSVKSKGLAMSDAHGGRVAWVTPRCILSPNALGRLEKSRDTREHAHKHTHIHTHAHAHAHKHTHTHTHTRTRTPITTSSSSSSDAVPHSTAGTSANPGARFFHTATLLTGVKHDAAVATGEARGACAGASMPRACTCGSCTCSSSRLRREVQGDTGRYREVRET